MSKRTTSQLEAREAFHSIPMDMLKDISRALEQYRPCTIPSAAIAAENRRMERYRLAARRVIRERQATAGIPR